jgi:hypothetical protein
LNQEIYTQFTQASINGCPCCTVVADNRVNTINTNTVTYVPGQTEITTPLNAFGTATCGFDGTARVTLTDLTGGSGQYQTSNTFHSTCSGALNDTFTTTTVGRSYLGVPNGTWFFAIRDLNNQTNATCITVVVDCFATGGGGGGGGDVQVQ